MDEQSRVQPGRLQLSLLLAPMKKKSNSKTTTATVEPTKPPTTATIGDTPEINILIANPNADPPNMICKNCPPFQPAVSKKLVTKNFGQA